MEGEQLGLTQHPSRKGSEEQGDKKAPKDKDGQDRGGWVLIIFSRILSLQAFTQTRMVPTDDPLSRNGWEPLNEGVG